jgi:hydrogenase nickel incorporation protein HypB
VSPDVRLIEIKERILGDNGKRAQVIRERLHTTGTFLLNLMSSPGSGKTSLILQTIGAWGRSRRIAVIEADMDSTVDADKMAAAGVPAVQLRTRGFCHVEASMVEESLEALPVTELDMIIIENVGNLICPAESDTGAHANVVILSVPEGDDKPLKYPLIFASSDAVVLNKVDYLEREQFDTPALRNRISVLNPAAAVLPLSCRTGAGVDGWLDWLEGRVTAFRSPRH